MFENTLLASSILALICAVILVAAAVIWMKYGKCKKSSSGNIKERAATTVSNDKAEESKSNWGETVAEYEDSKKAETGATKSEDAEDEETEDAADDEETVEEE